MDRNCYSPNRKKPLEKRSFTDCICFIGFLGFLFGWFMLAWWAYQNSDQENLLSPTDSNGQVCNYNKNVSEKPYLFFFDITECATTMIFVHGCQTPQVCVDKCPDADWSIKDELDSKPEHQIDWPTVQNKLICVSPDLNKKINSVQSLKNYTSSNYCAKYYIRSQPILNYCVPIVSDAESLINFIKNNDVVLNSVVDGIGMVEWVKDTKRSAKLIADDLINNYQFLIGGLGVAVVFSLVYILLLRWFSWMLIWVSFLSVMGLLGFGCYGSYTKYSTFRDAEPPTTAEIGGEPADVSYGGRQSWSNYLDAKLNSKNTWLWITVALAISLVVMLLIIVFLRKRIRLAIAIIVEGGRAILDIKSSLVFPVFQWLTYLAIISWFLAIAILLSSMKLYLFKVNNLGSDSDCVCAGDYYKDGDWCTESKWERYCTSNRTKSVCRVAKCAYTATLSQDFVTGLQLFNVFGMYWALNFVSGFSQMVLAVAFASWFWTFHKRDVPFFTLTRAVYKTMRYHLGTVAFGSLIIAVCNVLRALLEAVEKRLRKYDNAITRAVFACLRCFFWMLNKFLRFINRNAYIMCAMYGNNFCTSARQAFELLVRNPLRIIVIDKVTVFIFFIGKIIITGATMATFYYTFYEPLDVTRQTFAFLDKPHVPLNYKWLPLIIVFIGSWVISSTFFHVYSVAVDTFFLCFLEDAERNDGTSEHPYYMSKRLMNIVGKRNVQSFPMR